MSLRYFSFLLFSLLMFLKHNKFYFRIVTYDKVSIVYPFLTCPLMMSVVADIISFFSCFYDLYHLLSFSRYCFTVFLDVFAEYMLGLYSQDVYYVGPCNTKETYNINRSPHTLNALGWACPINVASSCVFL